VSKIRYYVDEHVSRAVVRGLRQRGVDVLSVPEANMLGASDEEHLAFARNEICEAEKLNKRVTASVCVSRLSGDSPIVILTPCGICQERFFHWGEEVEVAVPDPQDPTKWQARTLKEV